MKVVIGSTNPIKIEAVRVVFSLMMKNPRIEGREVVSGVASQPMSQAETIQGAKNRAAAAVLYGDYGVGLEGGVCDVGGTLFECAWAVVVTKSGEMGMGGGLYFELPGKIAARIRAGEELGQIMQELMRYDVKRSEGAIGVLTKGALTRQRAYEQIMKSAMVRFVSPEWYD